MTEPETPTPPIIYGKLTQRVTASAFDLVLVFILVLPLVDLLRAQMFPQLDGSALQGLMDSANAQAQNAGTNDPLARMLKDPAFWNYVRDQHVLARIIVVNLLQLFFLALYILPCWFRFSTTPGKMIFRLRIQDKATGAPMSDKQAILRFIGYIISAIPFSLGFLWVGLNKKCLGFHDYIAGTVVVVKPKKLKAVKLPEAPLT